MARISYIGDSGEPLEMVVGEDNPEVMVGRHRSCGIRTSTQSVSRKHARVFFDGDSYWLQDNGSSNGTLYQDNRLSPQDPVALDDGEEFHCGNFVMQFELDEEDLRRVHGGGAEGYEDTIDEVIDYGDEEVEATRFGEASDWDDESPLDDIPSPPGGGDIPPPPVPEPVPPSPFADDEEDCLDDFEPLLDESLPDQASPEQPLAMADAEVIEGLRGDVERVTADLEKRDAKIQSLEIELESISKRMENGADDEEKLAALQAEVEQLRVAASEGGQLREEFDKACEDADSAREEADKALAEIDELKGQLEEAQASDAADDGQAEVAAAEIASLKEQLAAAQAAEPQVDEAALTDLQHQLDTAMHDLEHAQEKYEEARAGRRNAEELGAMLRTQNEANQTKCKALEEQLSQLKSTAAVASAQGPTVAKAEFDAQVASTDAALAETDSVKAELAQAHADLEVATKRAAGAEAAAEADAAGAARVAELEAALAEAKAGAGTTSEADAAELVALGEKVAAQDAVVADLQAKLKSAGDNAGGVDQAKFDKVSKNLEMAEADREDLEAAQSANMKRIKKLLKDLDEARKEAADAKGAAGGGGDEALRSEVSRMVGDLNGAVSSFRNDFMQLSGACEQIRSDDADERSEGMEVMQESLDACSGRNAELKRLVRALRDELG